MLFLRSVIKAPLKDRSETLKKTPHSDNVYMYFITYSVKDICGSSRAKKKKKKSQNYLVAQESFVCCPRAVPAPLYLGIINYD